MALGRQEEPGTVGKRSGRGGEEASSVQQGEGGGGAGGDLAAARWEAAQGEGSQERGGWVGEIMICGRLAFSVFTHGGLFRKLTCQSTQNHRLVVNSQRLVNLSIDNLN
jgi:hypothetical protein